MDDSTKLRRTAIHESAHALCCASQLFRQGDGERIPGGVFLTIISILPTDETWGHYNLWPKTDDIRTLNSIDMAGATATYLSTGSMRNVLYEGRGDADFVAERMKVRAGDILCAWGSLLTGESSPFALTEWYEVLKDSFQLSSTIVENRWHAILSLAEHLIEAKEMNIRAIQDYLTEHRIVARDWRTNEAD